MSRVDPRILVVSLLFALPARAATIAAPGPDSTTIHLAGPVTTPGPGLAAARALGLAHGMRRVADLPGDWRSLALIHEAPVSWPARALVWIGCDGREVAAIEAFAMTPPLEAGVIRLGGSGAVLLDPGALWRRRYRGHGVGSVIFARFPVDSCRGDATSLRVGLARDQP